MGRELKFDESWMPLSQFPMRELNDQSPQCCWIALDFWAKEFRLTVLIWDAQKHRMTECECKIGEVEGVLADVGGSGPGQAETLADWLGHQLRS